MAKCKICATEFQGRGVLFKHMWTEHPKEARAQALQHLKPGDEHKMQNQEHVALAHAIQQEIEVIEQLYEDELASLKAIHKEEIATLKAELTKMEKQLVEKDRQIDDLNERVKEAHALLSQEQRKVPEPSKKKRWWQFWLRS
jgi:chromosome segregation ATPase